MAPGIGAAIWVACLFTAPLLVDVVYWLKGVKPQVQPLLPDMLTSETNTMPLEGMGMPYSIVPRQASVETLKREAA